MILNNFCKSSLITTWSRNPLINILLYLTSPSSCDKSTANLQHFVKKGAGNYLMKWMSFAMNATEKQEDDGNVLLDIISLVVKIGKNGKAVDKMMLVLPLFLFNIIPP